MLEYGSGGGGGFAKPAPEPTKLELERERLEKLYAERDTFTSGSAEYYNAGQRIERCQAKINILARGVTSAKSPDTSAGKGICEICHDSKSADPDVLVGCSHADQICVGCYGGIKGANPIRFRGQYGASITFDAISCPLCRSILAAKKGNGFRLAEVHMRYEKLQREIVMLIRNASSDDNIPLMRDLQAEETRLHHEEAHELNKIQREILEERRQLEEEERRRREEEARIVHDQNSRRNLETREGIIRRVRIREGLRCMISRGEPLPPGTVLTPFPPFVSCCTSCRISRMTILPNQPYGEFRPDEVVDELSTCTVCHNLLFRTWEQQAINAFRGEEERRVNELYQAMIVDQERHEEVTVALRRRAFLFVEVSELERPLRERLEQELLAADGNQRACERAQAKFERDLEEAQRKWNRKQRR